MADVNYNLRFVQSSGDVGFVVSRNSTTNIVDATSGAPNRLKIDHVMDQGYGSVVATRSTVVSATAATPIVATITTGNGALYATGDMVLVTGGLGDLNINGTFLTTVSGDAITLLGSATAGTYTASSASMIKINKAKSYHIALATAMAAVLNDKAVQG
jgi:hypothetical protein